MISGEITVFRTKHEQSVCLSLIKWIVPMQDFHGPLARESHHLCGLRGFGICRVARGEPGSKGMVLTQTALP